MLPLLYSELAEWWPLFSPPSDYAGEAAFYGDQLIAACRHTPETLLEFGSGGGNNAWHMKQRFEITMVDLAPAMIEVSRALNPECAHYQGDMRTFSTGKTYDAVFIQDASSFMRSEADLRAMIHNAARHLRPGGAALFAPDHTRESFSPHTEHGGVDRDGRGLRYLQWTWDPDPTDCSYVCDFAILMRDAEGSVGTRYDRHVLGALARETWLAAIGDAGLDARPVSCTFPGAERFAGEVFVGTKRT